jgi:putative ABC transport system permease protein
MRLSSVAHLYWTRLRLRLVQELLAITGIAIGVALVFAALVANTSLTGSVREMTDGVVGQADFQLVAHGSQGFDEHLLSRVKRIDGIETAAPGLEARVNLIGAAGRRSVVLLAGDFRFSGLGGTLLPQFTRRELGQPRGLALPVPLADDLGISVGQPVPIETGKETTDAPLGAALRTEDIGSLVESPVALAPLRFAQEITGMEGRFSRIFIRTEPGQEAAVEAAVRRLVAGRVAISPPDSDVRIFEQASFPTNQSTALFSTLSAIVGFLFAFSAVLLTVPQRQRLIADLQMAGHPLWVLFEVLLFDALVLGGVGTLIGLAVGDQVSSALFGSAPDYLAAAFAVGEQQIVTARSVAIASAAGMLAATVAVLVPVRDALRHHPLAPAQPPPRGTAGGRAAIAGMTCLAITTAIVLFAPAAALVGVIALTLGLLFLLPLVLSCVTRLFEIASGRWRSAIPTLVVLELRSPGTRSRTLALAATGAVAVFATVAIGGGNADLQRGLQQSAREIDRNADIWVTFQGQSNALGTIGFEASETMRTIRDVRGVERVGRYRGGFLDIGDHRTWVLAFPKAVHQPIPPSQIVDGDPVTASARVRSGGWVAVSEVIAEELDAGVGDRITLPTPVPRPLRVAAITTNLAWPPGAIMLAADDYARAWATDDVAALHVAVSPGAAPGSVATAIENALAPDPSLRVETTRQRTLRHYATAENALSRLDQISKLVLTSAVLAMATAMGGMLWQRRPSVARLKVDAFSELELWTALMLESLLTLGTGCLLGACLGLYGQVLLTRALEVITGFPVHYSTALASGAAVLALVTALAVAILALPGWLAVRVAPQPGKPM